MVNKEKEGNWRAETPVSSTYCERDTSLNLEQKVRIWVLVPVRREPEYTTHVLEYDNDENKEGPTLSVLGT